jgi:hypothetical protein
MLWALLLFLCTRVWLLTAFEPVSRDIPLYESYALETLFARIDGMSIYDYHRRIQDGTEALPIGNEGGRQIEYPPLAIWLVSLPAHFESTDFAFTREWHQGFSRRYERTFHIAFFLAELGVFLLFCRLFLHMYPNAPPEQAAIRVIALVVAGLALPHLLYERLDMLQAFFVFAGLYLLVRRRCYLWSFVFLSLGVHYKLVPIVLVPVWVVGATPVAVLTALDRGNLRRPLMFLVHRAVMLLAAGLAVLLPFWLCYGPECIQFIRVHQNLGMHVESVPSTLVLLLNCIVDLNVSISQGVGSFQLNSSINSAIISGNTLVLFICMSAASIMLIMHFSGREAPTDASIRFADMEQVSIANRYPSEIVLFTILFYGIAMCISRAFSPQYLIWLLALFPLAPLDRGRRSHLLPWVFVAVCALTTVIYPHLYFKHIVPDTTPLGLGLLTLRNGLFAGLVIAAYLLLRKIRRQEEPAK